MKFSKDQESFITLSKSELALFEGLSGFCIKLYIILKTHMNWRTYLVQNLSWPYLRSCMELEVRRGSHVQSKPTIQELRTAAKKLQERGLIELLSKERKLIFKICFSLKINKKNGQGVTLSPGAATEGATDMKNQVNAIKNNYKNNELKECDFYEKQIGATEGATAYLNNINNINIINNIYVDLEKDEEKAFVKFWEVYPRKDSKKRAHEIFLKKKLYQHLEMILQDLRGRSWDGGQYTPLPSTYLNQERWKDETKGELYVNKTTSGFNSASNQREQFWNYCAPSTIPIDHPHEIELNSIATYEGTENRED